MAQRQFPQSSLVGLMLLMIFLWEPQDKTSAVDVPEQALQGWMDVPPLAPHHHINL